MVTARPFRTNPQFYSSTLDWAEAQPEVQVERGQFIPWEVFREFDLSLGQSEEEIRQRYETTEDVRLTYRGVQAIAGASHWQFTAYKSTLAQFLPFQMDRPMGQVKQLDPAGQRGWPAATDADSAVCHESEQHLARPESRSDGSKAQPG